MNVATRSLRLALVAGALGTAPLHGQSATYEQLQAFSGLLNQIRLNYVDSVGYGDLVHAAIDGVLHSLDPHSYFISRADMERRASYESGVLAGTGIELDDIDGAPVVLTVVPGSPAAKAGIQAGDRLTMLNDTSVAGLAVETIKTRLIGEKGARLRLRLERGHRADPRPFSVNLKQEFIPARSVLVATSLDPQTGFLRLIHFYQDTPREVKSALEKLGSKGMKRLVLDLRGNPGGTIESAVEVAGLFLTNDLMVVRLEGRTRADTRTFRTDGNGTFAWLPMIVLVNEGTASAAETLAGSLQDHDRALIVGHRTFGKALAQRGFVLAPQGDVVFLTVARVKTPSGRIIQRPYHNLTVEQYERYAGQTPNDSTAVFHTAAGRTVRGGGGILPDVTLPATPEIPAWYVASAEDWTESLVDSVAYTLDALAFNSWKAAPAEWRTRLALPFYARVHERFGVDPKADSALTNRIALALAYRATEVRWGTDRAYELAMANDDELWASIRYFDKLEALLKP